jgi:hypothetical protein
VRWAAAFLFASSLPGATFYLTVAGLGGEPEYEQRFNGWASDLEKVHKATPDARVETIKGAAATRAGVRGALERIAKEAKAEDALVVMLIGHGSHDGSDYKFNLAGPDITGVELAGLLDRVPASRQLVAVMTSASGGAIRELHRENRVVITATKTGTERNAVVFARYWVEALRDSAADVDKNETISALEAYRYADQKTSRFYESQQRLSTEHAMLDDTGKGEGARTPSPDNGYGLVASAFPLMRLSTASATVMTADRRKLLARKEELEGQIDRLKYQKAAMPLDEYKRRLGAVLLELAKVQAELDK